MTETIPVNFLLILYSTAHAEGVHMTLGELKKMGVSTPAESGMYPVFSADGWEFGIYRDDTRFR